MLCFDVATFSPCAGQPYAVTIGVGDVSNGAFPSPATAAIGGEFVIPITVGGVDEIACFDPMSGKDCAGAWPLAIGEPSSSFGAPFPLLDAGIPGAVGRPSG